MAKPDRKTGCFFFGTVCSSSADPGIYSPQTQYFPMPPAVLTAKLLTLDEIKENRLRA
jgi:hypothetical protein